jgi:hypothetical protein
MQCVQASWREPEEFRTAMPGILFILCESIPHEQIRQALHALSSKPQPTRDLRHRGRGVLDCFENQPASKSLARRLCQLISSGGEMPDEPDDLVDEYGEGIPRR